VDRTVSRVPIHVASNRWLEACVAPSRGFSSAQYDFPACASQGLILEAGAPSRRLQLPTLLFIRAEAVHGFKFFPESVGNICANSVSHLT
jgi:hypothetical protein